MPGESRSTPSPGFLPRVGLCSLCTHARQVTSGKGSTFWFCHLSTTDPAYRKYPPLPVTTCAGFAPPG